MRRFFYRSTQRDSLRAKELENDQNNHKKPKDKTSRRSRLPKRKHLVSAFLLASLGNEAAHVHETHNPHSNRRERIEEMRQRLSEVENNSRRLRSMNAGGGGTPDPFQPVEMALQEARRRGNNTRPAQNV